MIRLRADEVFVNAFLRNAEEMFDVARATGGEDCDWNIVMAPGGGIHMMPGGDWPVESLRAARGAEAAYRVRRMSGQVRVEAARAGELCVLAAAGARELAGALTDFPRYLLA